MKQLVIYYMDGSRQVVRPRQETEVKGVKNTSTNFCGDWKGLVQAITQGNYLKYEVI